ncbi:MAG: hypothetical protein WBR21_05775 [Rouxiella badensis]|uniref:hypothetical protein n=1 Tax=Rouxiella badensis TaxID=1646377 RepID=UPI003C3B5F38
MWTAIVLVVLVCGYLYSNRHLPSKFKQQKAVGWNAYFDVAVHGGLFLVSGIALTCILWLCLWLIMCVWNLPWFFGWSAHHFIFAYEVLELRIFGLKLFNATVLGLTVLISVGAAKNAEKNFRDPILRNAILRQIANCSATESVIFEAIEKGLLLLITLKSRKVYVGMVDEARFNNLDTDTIVIIPLMSGYRHKDTLTFIVDHNYAEYYEKESITLTSEPLSVYQFRHVLPFEQIESLSLFNVSTYEKFNEKVDDAESKLDL